MFIKHHLRCRCPGPGPTWRNALGSGEQRCGRSGPASLPGLPPMPNEESTMELTEEWKEAKRVGSAATYVRICNCSCPSWRGHVKHPTRMTFESKMGTFIMIPRFQAQAGTGPGRGHGAADAVGALPTPLGSHHRPGLCCGKQPWSRTSLSSGQAGRVELMSLKSINKCPTPLPLCWNNH